MTDDNRKSGLDSIGAIPWGTHICQFYRTREDLVEILVPYFRAGLENNEFCLWITSEPLSKEDIITISRSEIPGFDSYVDNGQIEIISYDQWYINEGNFQKEKILERNSSKLEYCRSMGFEGMRTTTIISCLKEADQRFFKDFEAGIDNSNENKNILTMCNYFLDKCSATDVIDIIGNHKAVIIRRDGKWQVLEYKKQDNLPALHESTEQKFQDLFESIPDGILVLDAGTLKIISANKTSANIFGFEFVEEIIGHNLLHFIFEEDKERALRDIREDLFRMNLRFDKEYRAITRDNREIWIRVNGIQTEYMGKSAGVISIWNITEGKNTEKALKDSEARLQTMLSSLDDFIYTLDTEARHTSVFGTWMYRLGLTPEDLLGKTIREIFGEERAIVHENAIRKALTGESVMYEWEAPVESGTKYFQTSLSPLRDNDSNIFGLVAIGRNITERKQAEEELYLRSQLLDSAGNAICLLNRNGEFIYVNDVYCRSHGFNKEELIGMNIRQLDNTLNDEWFNWLDGELAKKGIAVFESTHRRKDGSTIELEVYSRVIESGGKFYNLSVERDITERKQAEDSLRTSELFNSSLLANSPNPINVINPDTSIRFVNPALEKLTGYTSEELTGCKAPYPFWDERLAEEALIALKDNMKIGINGHETRFYRKNRESFWVSITNKPVQKNGNFEYLLSTWTDITERKQAEEDLKESEERYRSLVNNLSLGIFRSTPEPKGKFLEVNRAMEYITGYTREELLSINLADLYSYPEKIKAALDEYDSGEAVISKEILYRKKDGSEIIVSDTRVPVKDAQGRVIYFDGILEDITRQKALEEESQKIEKLESIGILAGGIAHDFNNLLTGIMGNISLAVIHAEGNSPVLESLKDAGDASERARKLTQQLLTFSKGGAPVKKPDKLNEIIRENANFAIRGTGIKGDFSISEDLWMTDIDEGQIGQVITNIVINACEAMPGGGVIKIKAYNRVINKSDALPLTPGNYVEFSIEDNGTGIKQQYLDRIFDPYFTTKQKGSGLGLTTSYSIIKNHNGHIDVKSVHGSGTTFSIYLPAIDQPNLLKEENKEMKPVIPTGGKILVMDDENMIRQLLDRMLSGIGYKVVLTSDGNDAVKEYTEAIEKEERFDAVILDLTVPGGMNGLDTLKALLEIDPRVKAIVSSGYATDPIMSEYKKHGFRAVVNKPYNIAQMENTLSKLLSEE